MAKAPDARLLDGLPLATLAGEGSFRAARAVGRGDMAAILPAIAATELQGLGAVEVKLDILRHFERKMCVASNPRLVRLRPVLQKLGTSFAALCQY